MSRVTAERQQLLSDPQWLLFDLQLEQEKALWAQLTSEQLAAASFLDARVLPQAQAKLRTPLDWLQAAPTQTTALRWIFHCGHVGSTLLARLLHSPNTRVLREPQVLRTLAGAYPVTHGDRVAYDTEHWWQAWASPSLHLLARHTVDESAVLIKATSSASPLLPEILQRRPDDRALALAAPLDLYLAAFQISPSAQQDLHAYAPQRWQQFQALCAQPALALDQMSPAQVSAMSWLVTVAPLVHACRVFPQRCQALDFAQLMRHPQASAEQAAQHLHWPSPPAPGPWLNHYAKDPSQSYDSAQRWQQLCTARQLLTNQAEGLMAWLAHVLRDDDPLRGFLARGLVWG